MIAEEQKDLELIEKHFILVCFIVLDDPTRGEEASKAVSDCKKASINIKLVSGDSSEATKKVAKDTGILCDFDEICASHVLLEGQEFRNKVGGIITHSRKTRWGRDYIKYEPVFREIIKDLKVLSWASSEDKYLLVTGLKNEGFVVGVTGISPADTKTLLKADVGFTLNELGSEVAKHSSDVILRNDSLKSMVSGIMWGRNLFTWVKRYMQFYLTFVITLGFTILISTLLEGHIPLNLFQLLWLHILTEYFAMFALISTQPTYHSLLENTMNYDKRMLTNSIWRSIIMNSIYEIFVISLIHHQGDLINEVNSIFLFEEWDKGDRLIFTVIFQILFYFQISNILMARNLKSYEFNFFSGIWSTTGLVIILMILLQTLMVTYGGVIIQFTSLNIYLHAFTLIVGFSPLIWGTLVKCCVPLRFFKIRLNEQQLDRNDTVRCIQHYLRKKITPPSKRPVKERWRANSQNQYDTKGKKTITWDDEEMGPKVLDKNQQRTNIISSLRDNFEGIE